MAHARFQQLEEEYAQEWDPSNVLAICPWERFWVARYHWLKSHGYILRPRYSPDWVPSWKNTKKMDYDCEDGQIIPATRSKLIDATRISDGKTVVLKRIFRSKHPYEAEIGLFLCSEPLASDPSNHCISTYEILEDKEFDDMIFLVMPLLRPCTDPRFETIGEAIEFFRQTFEGIQFMHRHNIAHRDCSAQNIMMESERLYPNGFHPTEIEMNKKHSWYAKHYTRTERPTRYFLIDFGLSRRYNPKDGPPLEYPIRGGDKSVPEFQGDRYNYPSNPFFTDIYYLGNMIKEDFMDAAFGFDFMSSLVADMMDDDPSKRPTIDEVMQRYAPIYKSLNTATLRSRMIYRSEVDPKRWIRNTAHFFRTWRFIVLRIPPVPRCDSKKRCFSRFSQTKGAP